jgi:hypothetical protein
MDGAWAAMRGTAAIFCAGVLALLVVPPAVAHGAVAPREIDTRVLLDDEGLIEYGGCVEEQCAGVFAHDGLDLLSLDARELRLPDGRPGLALAVSFQWQTAGVEGRSVRLQFTAAGLDQVVTFEAADTDRPIVAGAERILGPTPIGDGDPRMLEAWFALPTLGLSPGLELTNISTQSRHGDTLDDAMPGGWYSNGIQVPHVPHSTDVGEATETHPPGVYRMKGPAPLLDLSAPRPDSVALPRSYTLTIRNPLGNLTQVVDAAVRLGTGAARLDAATLVLLPGATRTLNLTTSDLLASGAANLTLASDLGAWEALDLPIVVPPANTTAPAPKAKDSPAPAGILLAPLLTLALALRRRRQP